VVVLEVMIHVEQQTLEDLVEELEVVLVVQVFQQEILPQ
tara:strand:+ start:239 stop:355 length:117 start_codon:yes stop_codon:yes gene_type:complete